MNWDSYAKSLVIGCLLGFLFMTVVAWSNDALLTMLIGANWAWAMETIDITTFTGLTIQSAVPRIVMYVETNVFIWKNLVPWLCAGCAFFGALILNYADGWKAGIRSIIFGLVIWGFSWCWFSIEDWWGFLLRNLFPSVDPLHTLPPIFTYEFLGYPWHINIYGNWIPVWQYVGSSLLIGGIILIASYLVWRFVGK